MTTKPNTGGPAFPRATTLNPVTSHPWNDEQQGMSLRDWFAGMAMHGMVGNSGLFDQWPTARRSESKLAMEAYMCADAMLAEKDKSV